MTHTYDPDKVSVIINGTIITGFDASGVFTYTRSNDIVTPEVGVQGDVAYVENRNETGTLTLTLMASSPQLPVWQCSGSLSALLSTTRTSMTRSISVQRIAGSQRCRMLAAPTHWGLPASPFLSQRIICKSKIIRRNTG